MDTRKAKESSADISRGLMLVNLDNRTRRLMLSELEFDITAGSLYLSSRLNARGKKEYEGLLKKAIEGHDAGWLANNLRKRGLMRSECLRKKPGGKSGYTRARVPVDAPETLAEGEFNRFYIRGLCLRAIADGRPELEIYRAMARKTPRPGSEARVGERLNARYLFYDLRRHPGINTALGLPPGPNSGLSVRLPEADVRNAVS